jgi:hypothetical protein
MHGYLRLGAAGAAVAALAGIAGLPAATAAAPLIRHVVILYPENHSPMGRHCPQCRGTMLA